jgi:hypothetical protein
MDDIKPFEDDPTDYDAAAKDSTLSEEKVLGLFSAVHEGQAPEFIARVEKKYVCVMCGATKTWTVGEQEFMLGLKEQGLIKRVSCPKRCSNCRDSLKRKG